MFSELGRIYSSRLRRTESTDARLNIRRRNLEKEHKSSSQDRKPQKDADTSDQAVVSTEALRVFLDNFQSPGITKRPASEGYKQIELPFSLERQPASKSITEEALRAIHAYQKTAQPAPKTLMPSAANLNDVT